MGKKRNNTHRVPRRFQMKPSFLISCLIIYLFSSPLALQNYFEGSIPYQVYKSLGCNENGPSRLYSKVGVTISPKVEVLSRKNECHT